VHPTVLGPDGFVCEVTGVDCAAAGPAEAALIRDLLFEHRVLLLRGQRLTTDEYQRFMRRLGGPIHHVLQDLTVPGHPAVLKISDYVLPDGTPFGVLDGGSYWHSDMSYLPGLGVATSLYAVRAAAGCAGTSFLDLRRGWRLVREDSGVLSALGCADPGQALGVEVCHVFGNRHAARDSSAADQRLSPGQSSTLTMVRHRLVERHPVTGSPSLFAISGTPRFLGDADEEASARALDLLEEFLLAGLEPYTHRYRPGDLVLWDNMSTLHRGVEVRPTRVEQDSRLLHRINVNYAEDAAP
jgi:taurine dioxygenase